MTDLAADFVERDLEKINSQPARRVVSNANGPQNWSGNGGTPVNRQRTASPGETLPGSKAATTASANGNGAATDSNSRPAIISSLTAPVKLALKTNRKILFLNPLEILSIEAEGNYVLVRRQSDVYSLRESISSLAEKLKTFGFVRIHRSVLVNSSCVEEIRPGANGEYMLRISGGHEYAVSRTFKTNVKFLAGCWIGTDSFVDD